MRLVLKREEVNAKETDNQGKEVKYSLTDKQAVREGEC